MTATLTEQDQVGWGLSEITEAAALALRLELDCHPKPGLVTPRSMGSYGDMDHACMAQGIAAIAPFFQDLALAGRDGAGFADLKPIGLAAEQGMMTATGGVNTHRGAIFSLGLLVAATAGLPRTNDAQGLSESLGQAISDRWGADIHSTASLRPVSHGTEVARRYHAGGAREQAARGFPVLAGHVVPGLLSGLAGGLRPHDAAVQALFTAMAALEDTNLLYRGGLSGLRFAQAAAAAFLTRGGVSRAGWQEDAARIDRAFVARWLSPGGAADMLSASLFVALLSGDLSVESGQWA